MTPDTEKNTGATGAGVALSEKDASRSSVDESAAGEHSSDVNQASGAGADGHDPARDAGGEETASDSVKKAEFQEVSDGPIQETGANIDLLLDVVVPVSVELGRTMLTVKDILSTCQGSVIELNRAAGEPVEVLVGGKTLAKGEVVVVKDRFGVRITEIVGSVEGVATT